MDDCRLYQLSQSQLYPSICTPVSKALDYRKATNLEFHELELFALSKIRLFIKISFKSIGAITVLDTGLYLVNLFSRLLNENFPGINEVPECALIGTIPGLSLARRRIPGCCQGTEKIFAVYKTEYQPSSYPKSSHLTNTHTTLSICSTDNCSPVLDIQSSGSSIRCSSGCSPST